MNELNGMEWNKIMRDAAEMVCQPFSFFVFRVTLQDTRPKNRGLQVTAANFRREGGAPFSV